MEKVVYNINATRRIRAGMIGCGHHPYMNVLPSFRYAPVDLIATCDVVEDRAREYARIFGAERAYADYQQMLEKEHLDAVFVVTNYTPDGRPRYPDICKVALAAGCHVWMEKPPGWSVADVRDLQAASARAGRFVQVGVKKPFYPAVDKIVEISRRPEFGKLVSLYATYPLLLPPLALRRDRLGMRVFLDVLWHPAGAIHAVGGAVQYLTVRSHAHGSGALLLKFKNGAVGVLHITGSEFQDMTAGTLESMEVIGQGQSLTLENNIRLTWHRQAAPPSGGYQRATSFVGADDSAALHWEPEMSRGTVYNSNHMLSGYAVEINHFAQAVLENQPPTKGDLESCAEIMAWHDAVRLGIEGERIDVPAILAGERVVE